MITGCKKIHLLGLAPSSIAIQLSLLKERYGECEFHIYKNIQVSERPDLRISSEAFRIKIHPVGRFPETDSHSSGLLLFGVSGPNAKEKVYNYFYEGKGCQQENYHTFIHSGAYVSPETQLDNGVFIEPGALISTQTTVGFGATIKRGVLIGHHNRIGKYCEMNPGVVLSGNVSVGEKTVIGTGSVVKNGVSIGANTMIGMGSNVVSDIPPNVVAYGNPCRVVKEK
jgi:sugar O-acyltransferase (sialic acid O-acetyltransferase NeuD family)